jgi:hypothetical protein
MSAQDDSRTNEELLRAALMARITDEDGDTIGEAMVGLARRHDERVVDGNCSELTLLVDW